MTLQHGVEFEEYYRCYVVGQEKVHIMKYDPRAPHHERYVKGNPPPSTRRCGIGWRRMRWRCAGRWATT